MFWWADPEGPDPIMQSVNVLSFSTTFNQGCTGTLAFVITNKNIIF